MSNDGDTSSITALSSNKGSDGLISLREAITAANNTSGLDTIDFGDGSAAGGADFLDAIPDTITLSGTQLVITDSVTITGPSTADLLTIDADHLSRVFNVDNVDPSAIDVELVAMTLTGGLVTGGVPAGAGGGIRTLESLTVRDSVITGNQGGKGGGIYAYNNAFGTTTIQNSTLSGNTANDSGGGIYSRTSNTTTIQDSLIYENSASLVGGGIFSHTGFGTTTIQNSMVSGNTAGYYGGGMAAYTTLFGMTIIQGNTVSGNSAYYGGGGIATITLRNGTARIQNSTVSGNYSADYGGGAALTTTESGTTTFQNNTVSGNYSAYDGGGIWSYTQYSTLTVENSVVAGNSAYYDSGGGVKSQTTGGATTIENSTISGNSAYYDGGGINSRTIQGGITTIRNSTISENAANYGYGGGTFSFTSGGTVMIQDSTVSGNSSYASGGGIASSTFNGSTTIQNSTVSGNSASTGGGIFSRNYDTTNLMSSIVAGNTATTSAADFLHSTLPGTDPEFVTFSLIGDNIDSGLPESHTPDMTTHNLVGQPVMAGGSGTIDPLLDALADNGGLTKTMALRYNSPALDLGSNPANLTTDQRGAPFSRDDGNGVDMGAYERQSVAGLRLVVDTVADENDGDYSAADLSLREAIGLANGSIGVDTVMFDIAGSGPHTIAPLSALPAIIDPVIIDGTSEPDFADAPIVEIDGSSTPAPANGFYLQGAGSSGSTIRGLVINGFNAAGVPASSAAIRVDNGSDGNTISGNYLGLDADGSTVAANRFGLHISSANNMIEGNVISGNNRGILLNGGGADNNTVRANLIGTNAGGNASRGNTTDGVKIRGGSNNTIGGPSETDGNTISANVTGAGVAIFGGSANNNTVQHNLIGTKSTGDANRGNNVGINLIGAPGTTIKDNVVAGSKRQAIRLIKPDTTGTLIENNLIGIDLTGAPIGTTYDGIQIANAPDNTIRGNVIANSGYNGIRLLNAGATGNIVQGNLIGTALDGTTPMGNALAGILIKNAPGNQIGGMEPGEGNTISANGEHGILIERPGATDNTIEGNQIGTDIAGTTPLSNGSHGIQISDGTGNVIGGIAAGAGNAIGGNGGAGIAVTGGIVTIQGNFIGTDAGGMLDLGNTSDGIIVNGGLATIGGEAVGAGNTIAHNGNNGVKINSGTGNAIHRNSIHDNAALGIDLKPNGVTTNDTGDADDGANNRQNFPVLTSAVSSGGNTTISGTLNSIANSTFTVEFFSSPTADPSGFGEGQVFLGSTVVDTDGSGNMSFSPTFDVAVTVGHVISATATDANGNTSEFSAAMVVSDAMPAAGRESDGGSARSMTHPTPMPIVIAPVDRLAATGLSLNVSEEQRAESRKRNEASFVNRKLRIANHKSIERSIAVMDELAHAAGLDDLDGTTHEDDLMFDLLGAGEAETSLVASLADAAFAEM